MFVKIGNHVLNVERIDYIYYSKTGQTYFVRIGESVTELNEESGEALLEYIHNKLGITVFSDDEE